MFHHLDDMKHDPVEEAVRTMVSHLERHHPSVQGLILAELVSIWINGHIPERRGQAVNNWVDVVAEKVKDTMRGAH